MDIKDIKEEQDKLKVKLLQLIGEFEKNTSTKLSDIEIYRHYDFEDRIYKVVDITFRTCI